MPLIAYTEQRFNTQSVALIKIANAIIDEYQAQGFSLTLRQLYYQFVARGHIENSLKSYKMLGGVVNNGRLCGLIEDRIMEVIDLDMFREDEQTEREARARIAEAGETL